MTRNRNNDFSICRLGWNGISRVTYDDDSFECPIFPGDELDVHSGVEGEIFPILALWFYEVVNERYEVILSKIVTYLKRTC